MNICIPHRIEHPAGFVPEPPDTISAQQLQINYSNNSGSKGEYQSGTLWICLFRSEDNFCRMSSEQKEIIYLYIFQAA